MTRLPRHRNALVPQALVPQALLLQASLCVPAALGLLTGCLPYDAVEHPSAPVELPGQYTAGGEETPRQADAADTPWWTDFADPRLNAMEEALFTENLELRAAWARLRQAQALTSGAAARRLPQVAVSASAGRQRQRFGSFPSQEFSMFSLSAPISYELDLFDRLGSEEVAAELDAVSTRQDAESLALVLSAQLADVWFQTLEAHARVRLLSSQKESQERFLELLKLRFEQGIAPASDVTQQEAQSYGTRAQLSQAKAARQLLLHQLALLLGKAPGSPAVPTLEEGETSGTADALPNALPTPPVLGVPADLLLHRPDVRAAQLRVVAADRRVGIAIASWFPSLSLSGSVGFNANSLGALFEEIIWSFVGSLSQAIFDGGQRSAQIDLQRAVLSERLDGFANTLLTAIHEVENALVQERQQVQYLSDLTAQVNSLRSSHTQAVQRYRQGLTDFLPVLTTQTALQNAELALVGGKRTHISYRIQLYRALGGSWTQRLLPAPLREAEEAPDNPRQSGKP